VTKADALYFIPQAIPCMLHLENRTHLKWKILEVISQIMNEEIICSLQNRAQWKMPTESNRGGGGAQR
jgi:hypothetical protein